MRAVRSGFQLRVCLSTDEEWMIFDLDHFYDTAVRGDTNERHSLFNQYIPVIIINLITMSVAFMDFLRAIQLVGFACLIQLTWLGTETERTADIGHTVLVRHQVDDRMVCLRIDLCTVGI